MDAILSAVAAVAAFAVTAVLGFFVIPYLHKLHFGQTILDIGPNWHKSKQGTPTMGGVMFIAGILISLIVCVCAAFALKNGELYSELVSSFSQQRLALIRLLAGTVMALSFALIGFFDDYIKVVKKRNLGLTARQKTLLQLLVAAAFLATLILSGDYTTYIPFVGQVDVSKGIGLIYWPIALMFIYGFVNSVNLTDGVDGLCTSVTMIVAVFFMVVSATIIKISGLNILSCAVAGGCCGFLVWNLKPAKVFMGDTGSLFLGGIVVAMAFASGCPILLLLSGILYLLEALSVIIQVSHYKRTKKRVFKMTPIHHHFEMSGWSENKIVVVFSCVTLVGSIIALLFLQIG